MNVLHEDLSCSTLVFMAQKMRSFLPEGAHTKSSQTGALIESYSQWKHLPYLFAYKEVEVFLLQQRNSAKFVGSI